MRKPGKPRALVQVSGDTPHTVLSHVNPNAPIPRAPFYGSRVVDEIPLDEVFAFVNETALFKGQWQFKQGKRSIEDYRKLVAEHVRPTYDALKTRSKRDRLLTPRIVYGP